MDADRLMSVVTARDGVSDKAVQFMLSTGMVSSALEHSVPEQLFSTDENKAEGVSAVKALQIANAQGIPIYTVTQSNLATVLPQLQLNAQVKTDIQNAVNAGKTVTVSKTDINFHGWMGCGYIITDPTTGAGAYMLSGGTNGAHVQAVLLLIEIFLYCLAAAGAVAIALLATIFAGVPGEFAATLPTFAGAISYISTITTFIGSGILSLSYEAYAIMLEYETLIGLFTLLESWNNMTPQQNSIFPDTDNVFEMICFAVLSAVIFW